MSDVLAELPPAMELSPSLRDEIPELPTANQNNGLVLKSRSLPTPATSPSITTSTQLLET